MPGTTPLPAIHWDRLADNAAEQKVGWSFMDDVRNKTAIEADKPQRWLRAACSRRGVIAETVHRYDSNQGGYSSKPARSVLGHTGEL